MQPRVVEVSGGHRGDKADRHTGLRAFPPNQALPEDSLGVPSRELSKPFPPFSLFLFCFQGKKQPSPWCGGHYWHCDWGPACADAAGSPGVFHFPSQVQWHSQMLLLPQVDAIVLEEGHPILHLRPGSPGPPHFPTDILFSHSSVPASPGIDLWQLP